MQAALEGKPASRNRLQGNNERAKEASNALVMEALKRRSQDNVTVIVILMQWD
jgi:serine/threonine protein phosphatase PrpC